MRRRFFVEAFAGGAARLVGDAAHHLGRVLRAEPGQLYELSDGHSVFLARIERVSGDHIDFSLLEKVPASGSSMEIVILPAIVKFDRFEWALEKATELGVSTIVPLAAERSEKALVSAAAKRATRWRKILLESAQQARCLRPPRLEDVTRPAAAFRESAASVKVLLSERSTAVPLRTVFGEAASKMGEGKLPPADRIGHRSRGRLDGRGVRGRVRRRLSRGVRRPEYSAHGDRGDRRACCRSSLFRCRRTAGSGGQRRSKKNGDLTQRAQRHGGHRGEKSRSLGRHHPCTRKGDACRGPRRHGDLVMTAIMRERTRERQKAAASCVATDEDAEDTEARSHREFMGARRRYERPGGGSNRT